MNNDVKPPANPTEEELKESPCSKWPEIIYKLFILPPCCLMKRFRRLFDSFVNAVGTETVIEFYQAYDVAILTWKFSATSAPA